MRILGIDLGTTSVKAVELDSAFGRFEIHEYHEKSIAPGTSALQAAAELVQSLPRQPDKTVISMSNPQVTYRNLQLPTRDRKSIQSSVAFELEDELPFSLELAAFDTSILSQSAQQGTHIHIATTLKKYLAEWIESAQTAGLDPDVITTETWAYRTLFNRIARVQSQEHPALLLQVGHTHTTFYVHWRGFPILTREIPWGGAAIISAIAKSKSLSPDQAAELLRAGATFLTEENTAAAAPDQIELSNLLEESLVPLLKEIRQTQLMCKNVTHHKCDSIFLAGGTPLIPGFATFLEGQVKIPVQPLQTLSKMTSSGVTYTEHTDATFALAAALALCQVGTERTQAIQFRKGDFAKKTKGREINVQALRKPLIATVATLLCILTSLIVEGRVYQSRIKDTDAQLERSIRSFFGEISNSAVKTYVSNTTSLKNSLQKEINKQRELSKLFTTPPNSPLSFLKELSSTVPKDVVVDMAGFQVGASPEQAYDEKSDAQSSLSFVVSNPQIAEKLNSILGTSLNNLEKNRIEEVSPTRDQPEKRWKITFTGKPTEASYGKNP